MAIEQRVLPDFSGGEIALKSSVEAQENQWLLLKGFVLDNNRRLRSQWPGATWVVELEEGSDEDSGSGEDSSSS
jgi:hypothetical protein